VIQSAQRSTTRATPPALQAARGGPPSLTPPGPASATFGTLTGGTRVPPSTTRNGFRRPVAAAFDSHGDLVDYVAPSHDACLPFRGTLRGHLTTTLGLPADARATRRANGVRSRLLPTLQRRSGGLFFPDHLRQNYMRTAVRSPPRDHPLGRQAPTVRLLPRLRLHRLVPSSPPSANPCFVRLPVPELISPSPSPTKRRQHRRDQQLTVLATPIAPSAVRAQRGDGAAVFKYRRDDLLQGPRSRQLQAPRHEAPTPPPPGLAPPSND